MKKKSAKLDYKGRSVSLYWDDMATILAIFKNHCKEVTISDDENEYDDLDELRASRGGEVSKLDISSFMPSLYFQKDNGLRFWGSGDASLPFIEITSILDRRKRRLLNFVLSPTGLSVLFVVYASLVWLGYRAFHPSDWYTGIQRRGSSCSGLTEARHVC